MRAPRCRPLRSAAGLRRTLLRAAAPPLSHRPRMSGDKGSSGNPAAKPPRPKTPKPGVREGFAPRLLGRMSGDVRTRTDVRQRGLNIVIGLLYFNRRTCVFKLFLDFRRLFLVNP